MGLTFDEIVVITVSYGLTFLLCLNVGSSSLGYFVSLYKPPRQKLTAFLDGLKFPFDIFASSRERTLTNLLKVETNREQTRRILYSIVALSVHFIAFVFFASFATSSQVLVSSVWMLVYIVTHYSMWRFGSKLKSI